MVVSCPAQKQVKLFVGLSQVHRSEANHNNTINKIILSNVLTVHISQVNIYLLTKTFLREDCTKKMKAHCFITVLKLIEFWWNSFPFMWTALCSAVHQENLLSDSRSTSSQVF